MENNLQKNRYEEKVNCKSECISKYCTKNSKTFFEEYRYFSIQEIIQVQLPSFIGLIFENPAMYLDEIVSKTRA